MDPAGGGRWGTQRVLYVFDGSVMVAGRTFDGPVGLVLRADSPVAVTAGADGADTLVLQGRPIGEPVAMGGPFVLTTRQEIETAYVDFRRTGFGGWPWADAGPVHAGPHPGSPTTRTAGRVPEGGDR